MWVGARVMKHCFILVGGALREKLVAIIKKSPRTTSSCLRIAAIIGLTALAASKAMPSENTVELIRITPASGGVIGSIGGDYELSGSVALPVAGQVALGGFDLTCGFWTETLPGDCDADGQTTLADVRHFVDCLTGSASNCACSDVDNDANVDLHDFAAIQQSFSQP